MFPVEKSSILTIWDSISGNIQRQLKSCISTHHLLFADKMSEKRIQKYTMHEHRTYTVLLLSHLLNRYKSFLHENSFAYFFLIVKHKLCFLLPFEASKALCHLAKFFTNVLSVVVGIWQQLNKSHPIFNCLNL